MPQIELPFRQDGKTGTSEGRRPQSVALQSLPSAFQEVCSRNPHLLEYLSLVPIEEVGVPEYCPELTKKLQDVKQRNFIYPVDDHIFVHIFSSLQDERDYYIPIEPCLAQNMDGIIDQVEARLANFTEELAKADTDEKRKETFLECIDKICTTNGAAPQRNSLFAKLLKNGNLAPVRVTPQQLEVLKYLVLRDKIGMGILEAMIRDRHIEDISCSGLGNVFVEHKVFRSLKSAITFSSYEDLDEFVLRLSERIRRPVTLRRPIVDAVLPDGSRVNIVFGKDISQRGSNFSIRKFNEVPLSILQLIESGSLDYRMAAYLWIIIEEGMNVFVSGETASGKTTLLNAITTFIPLTHKVVSIEDTPELQVPHQNWIREMTKGGSKEDTGAEVTMFDLLKAALRQRPNMILVGEIRGEEGNIAFQAMQTGHAVMATFHASSTEKLIQRLTGEPIRVPKNYVDNLNVVVIQSAVKLPSGKMGRRALAISEIVGYDPSSSSFTFVDVFRWNPAEDNFEFVAERNSYLLEQKVATRRGIPPERRWQIYAELDNRAKLLERLHKEKGVTNFYELLQALATARRKGVF
jgi:flagellar protein FlaI